MGQTLAYVRNYGRSSRLLLLNLALWTGSSPVLAEEERTSFADAVKGVTGDWTAQDDYSRDGNLLLRPETFTELSPITMRLLPEEPALGRTARAVLLHHFDPTTMENEPVDFSVVETINDRTIGVGHAWLEYNDDRYFGLWGVITTARGTFVPFFLKCRQNHEYYSLEQCMKAGSAIMGALNAGQIRMPEPKTPLAVSGYRASYGNDGFVTLTKSNYNFTVKATIRISPPIAIEPSQMADVLKTFSTTLFDQYDLKREDISAARFVGSPAEPWIRRELDQASHSPQIVMAGLVKQPDGRYSMVGVNCPGPGWLVSCAYGIDQAKLFVTTGIAEQRRLAQVSAAITPLPAKGLRTSDIASVYSVGSVIGTNVYNEFAFLLKDGRAYDGDVLAPQMIDAAASANDAEIEWGRWTRKGSGVVVIWSDGESDELSDNTATMWSGGTKSTRLSGYFGRVIVSGNAFSGGTVNRSGYTLNPDGTFQSASSSSFSVSAYLPNGNAGPTQIASGASSSQSATARYEIDGFMITFYHPDGRIERESFAVPSLEAGDLSPTQIMIGGSIYQRDFG